MYLLYTLMKLLKFTKKHLQTLLHNAVLDVIIFNFFNTRINVQRSSGTKSEF